jgi:nucleotide-binding universal stress UspA family protein
MVEELLSNVVVPVAGPDDAAATVEAALPHVAAAGGVVTAVYVVEKAGGGIDKASVEQREELAAEAFAVVEEACADAGIDCDTHVLYGTDVVDAIVEAARDRDASAIVFSPRAQSRWIDLITGDLSDRLVTEADRPVVVFPDAEADE